MRLVSVIIPTYNQSNLLSEAIESVLQQSLQDFEIVISDDGSTDDTAKVVRCIKDNRIKYFYKQNRGLASARNAGIVNAGGKYIAFLDSDDLYTKKYLEIMTGRLDENEGFGLAYSQFTNIYPDGHRETGFKEDRLLSGKLTRNFFGRMPCILPSATVLRREVLKDFYFDENLKLTEDIDFFMRLSAKTKFLCVPEATVTRRVSDGSLSNQATRTINPNTALILERFFYHFNNERIVPAKLARKKISREYRGLARQHYKAGNRKATIELLKKAIAYHPYDQHYYKELLKAFLLRGKNDKMPGWQMPKPLPPHMLISQKP
jgi:glycosyltransferase involved in cell wall biosynthesis